MSAPSITQVATNTYLVDGGLVNWYLVVEGDSLLLVDAGYPGYRRALEESIQLIGHRPEQIVAMLLTHAHVDHVGSVPQLLRRYRFPVLMDAEEVPHARGERLDPVGPTTVLRHVWRPGVPRWGLSALWLGGTESVRLPTAQAVPPGRSLDLPGRPVPVPTRGHTSGHCSYYLPDAGAVVTGDALITGHPLSQVWGPQLPPAMFSSDRAAEVDALDALPGLDADLLLPGHGTPYCGSLPEAVALARSRG